MNKIIIHIRGYGIIFLMLLVSLFFAIISAVIAGSIGAAQDIKKYYIAQVKPQIDEILHIMKEQLKNVD